MQKVRTNPKISVQRNIVVISILLLIGKVVAYQLTNSIGILTDALESIVNVVAGLISLYSISIALKPKDADHPFGHGKVEFLSASLEGFLISLAGLFIIYEAIYRLFVPSEIRQLDIGIIIIALAGLINYLLGMWSIRVGKQNHSIALVAGGKHLQSDTYSTIGLVIGLLVLYFTHLAWLDSAIAISFGAILIITGYKILKETTASLMDETDFKVLDQVIDTLNADRSENWVDICNMKIVKYGESHHIDCDLTLPWYFNINDAKIESNKLKKVLNAGFAEAIDLTIHTIPCTDDFCRNCQKANCDKRAFAMEKFEKWTIEKMTTNECSKCSGQEHWH